MEFYDSPRCLPPVTKQLWLRWLRSTYRRGGKEQLVSVGVGGSLNTALAWALSARTRGLRAIALSPTELLDGSIDVPTAFIVLSDPAKAADRRSTPLAAGQTGNREMQGCRKSTCKVPQRGRGNRGPLPEQPVAPAYSSVLQALGVLTDAITQSPSADWAKLPAAVATTLSTSTARVEQAHISNVEAAHHRFRFTGACFGTACQGALIAREAARKPAAAYDLYNYLHGYLESLQFRNWTCRYRKRQGSSACAGCSRLWLRHPSCNGASRMYPVAGRTGCPGPIPGDELADALLAMLPIEQLVAGLTDGADLADAQFRYRQPDTKVA